MDFTDFENLGPINPFDKIATEANAKQENLAVIKTLKMRLSQLEPTKQNEGLIVILADLYKSIPELLETQELLKDSKMLPVDRERITKERIDQEKHIDYQKALLLKNFPEENEILELAKKQARMVN